MGKGTHGVQKLQLEIQANHHDIQVLPSIHWLGNPHIIKEQYWAGDIQSSSTVFTVKGSKVTETLTTKGVLLGGAWFTVDYYAQEGPDSQYVICQKWGYIQEKCPTPNAPRYGFCVKNYLTSQYEYHMMGCSAPRGAAYTHGKAECHCANCGRNYFAKDSSCEHKKRAIEQAKAEHLWPVLGRPPKWPTSPMPPVDTDSAHEHAFPQPTAADPTTPPTMDATPTSAAEDNVDMHDADTSPDN
jgi:hypothetical protein